MGRAMTEVDRILFDLPALQAFEGGFETVPHVLFGELGGLRLNISPATEGDTAALALSDGVIGVVVGKLQNGAAALWALKSNIQLVV